jgi:hypothetical protein
VILDRKTLLFANPLVPRLGLSDKVERAQSYVLIFVATLIRSTRRPATLWCLPSLFSMFLYAYFNFKGLCSPWNPSRAGDESAPFLRADFDSKLDSLQTELSNLRSLSQSIQNEVRESRMREDRLRNDLEAYSKELASLKTLLERRKEWLSEEIHKPSLTPKFEQTKPNAIPETDNIPSLDSARGREHPTHDKLLEQEHLHQDDEVGVGSSSMLSSTFSFVVIDFHSVYIPRRSRGSYRDVRSALVDRQLYGNANYFDYGIGSLLFSISSKCLSEINVLESFCEY